MVDRGGLENRWPPLGVQGFESLSLRKKIYKSAGCKPRRPKRVSPKSRTPSFHLTRRDHISNTHKGINTYEKNSFVYWHWGIGHPVNAASIYDKHNTCTWHPIRTWVCGYAPLPIVGLSQSFSERQGIKHRFRSGHLRQLKHDKTAFHKCSTNPHGVIRGRWLLGIADWRRRKNDVLFLHTFGQAFSGLVGIINTFGLVRSLFPTRLFSSSERLSPKIRNIIRQTLRKQSTIRAKK